MVAKVDQVTIDECNDVLKSIDLYMRGQILHRSAEREAFIEVVKQLLKERGDPSNHVRRKLLHHAAAGDIYHVKKNLARLGIDPKRIDAILPLLRE